MSDLRADINAVPVHGSPFTIGIGVIGLDATKDALRAWAGRKTKALPRALYRLGETIMGEAKLEVPVDTGALRSSGHVQLPETSGPQTRVQLGFGGPATPYALRQHETPPTIYHHTVGKWKYLEDPFRRIVANADAIIAADLRNA